MLRPYSRPEYLEFTNTFSTNYSNIFVQISPHIPLFIHTSFKNRYSSFPVGNETGEYGVGNAGVFASEVFYFALVTEYLCGDVRFVHSDWQLQVDGMCVFELAAISASFELVDKLPGCESCQFEIGEYFVHSLLLFTLGGRGIVPSFFTHVFVCAFAAPCLEAVFMSFVFAELAFIECAAASITFFMGCCFCGEGWK